MFNAHVDPSTVTISVSDRKMCRITRCAISVAGRDEYALGGTRLFARDVRQAAAKQEFELSSRMRGLYCAGSSEIDEVDTRPSGNLV